MSDEQFVIVQLSDIHCGDARFDASLMEFDVTMRNTGTATQRSISLPRRRPEDRGPRLARRGSALVSASM